MRNTFPSYKSMQCAAVMAQASPTRVAPQKGTVSPSMTSMACQGYSFTSTTLPPTIRRRRFTRPQAETDSSNHRMNGSNNC